jgi:hypothetical protein
VLAIKAFRAKLLGTEAPAKSEAKQEIVYKVVHEHKRTDNPNS